MSNSQIDGQRVQDPLLKRTQELQALVQVAQLINVIDLDYVLAQILKLITEVLGATKGSLILLDAEIRPYQRFITQRNLPPAVSQQVASEVITYGLAGWCIKHREGAIIGDVTTDKRWHTFPDDGQDDVRSALCVPIIYEQTIDGIVTLVSPLENFFDEADLRLAKAVANQASTALRNAKLFDILQAKQRETELILQNTREALLTINNEFNVMMLNNEARQLLVNAPGGELMGRSLAEVGAGSVYGQIIDYIQTAPKPLRSLSFEIGDEARRRDYVANISALHNEQTQVQKGFIITLHDISSIKEMERLKTQTIYMLTHDLKNPINVIWGYADLLRIDAEQKLPADGRFVEGILKALHRMDNLIEETLSTERFMSTGQLRPQKSFSPRPIIREAIDSLVQLANQKQLLVKEDLEPNIANVVGDPFQLREVMINLISNAIKYTPNSGQLTVHASSDAERFNFYVKDTGIGIPEALHEKLFTEFYRASRPEMRGIAGTGLGLSLVKKIVERHHGHVWFESKENAGSTFGFWLPVAPQ